MPNELRRWVKRKKWEALRAAELHGKRGATLAKRYADGRASVLAELLKRFPKQPRRTSGGSANRRLTKQQADKIEEEMRRMESDPTVAKTELRLFMQLPMPCGHATGNLLTCDKPPFGCVICARQDSPNEKLNDAGGSE
jgi:hypothetical protein